ncbi:uncharacterized protein N7484_005811 [Penicillium longicatenatum]|uniref:uncharacterized protein n=1 Tax=Penicillium longicatenatum TaxID=1561947 RepID=UPI002548AA22|nr:uncharacterized protein N7484_005811 [Penicillium longicatenatum]KAJ5643304.1 hypothetical protein N7484_005811 [Penicillium longicatenatum]
MTAFEQAGSLFTGWIRSCWSCLLPGEKGQDALRSEDHGIKREMEVCHTQPHLVPPMKLKVYDDLPNPRMNHTRNSHSLSSWLEEGRNLASRASYRASLTTSRRRQPTTSLKISGPSDFRRVESFHDSVAVDSRYKPLDLSIHRSGNRLSDLPSFESFQIDEDSHSPILTVPPRALSHQSIRHRRCVSTASGFTVSRKPVGSGDRRSLGSMHLTIESEAQKPVHIASPLVPHFSIVTPVKVKANDILLPKGPLPASALRHNRPDSGESKLTLDTDILSDSSSGAQTPRAVQDLPQTPVRWRDTENTSSQHSPNESSFSFLRDSPSTSSSSTFPSRLSSLRRPSFTPSDYRKTVASVPLPDRVSQWFSREKDVPPNPISLDGENKFEWERTRTLSGTTVASTITTITGGAKSRPPNFSISSSFTGSSTPRASLHQPSISRDKEIESGIYRPTIYEGRPQHPGFATSRHGEPIVFQEATIGVAF